MLIARLILVFGLLLVTPSLLAFPPASYGQVAVSIIIAPPELPVYEQPICPGEGFIWTPGYWAWDGDDYYWVPGTWILAPEVGFLWTPGYWGWSGTSFIFYQGYWGPRVGFYGGINYGFGYFGHGYEGGRWDHDRFYYNRAVNNVNITEVHNVYNTTVVNKSVTRVSYNGGNGGINERPTREEETVAHEKHIPPVAVQTEHVQAARANSELRASKNHGKPPVAATSKPAAFNSREVVPANGAERSDASARSDKNARPDTSATHPNNPVHAKELPPATRPVTPTTGNAKLDKKYQQQQEKLSVKQDQDQQKLQQKQEKDHQQLAKQKADDARMQQTEQKHQQQTQQLVQKHTQQQQKLQEKQQPPPQHQNQAKPPK